MSDLPAPATTARARSFGSVAEVYDRARPSYPTDVVGWLVGGEPKRVLELGAGTGKLTELLVAAGHTVIATDPSVEMLAKLRDRTDAAAIAAPAEAIPVPSRSVDVVVCAESFHWFDHGPALNEIARVLREDGHIALVWNFRDEGIPWVRKLGRIMNGPDESTSTDRVAVPDPVDECGYFGHLESQDFRMWQNLRKDELLDLVRSRSRVAVMSEQEREDVLARVSTLYDDYGRGPDGMQLPYLTRCHKARIVDQPPAPVVMSRVEDEAIHLVDRIEPDDVEHSGELTRDSKRATVREDTGTLLIDFS